MKYQLMRIFIHIYVRAQLIVFPLNSQKINVIYIYVKDGLSADVFVCEWYCWVGLLVQAPVAYRHKFLNYPSATTELWLQVKSLSLELTQVLMH